MMLIFPPVTALTVLAILVFTCKHKVYILFGFIVGYHDDFQQGR